MAEGSIPPEEIHCKVVEVLTTKTTHETEVEIRKHGSEQKYIKDVVIRVIGKIVAHKLLAHKLVTAGTLGAVGASAVAATAASQFHDFTTLKPADLSSMDFFTGSQKDLLLSASNVDPTDIVSGVDPTDIVSGAGDFFDTIISVIGGVLGLG